MVGHDMTSRCTHLKARLHEANPIEQLRSSPLTRGFADEVLSVGCNPHIHRFATLWGEIRLLDALYLHKNNNYEKSP